MEASTSIVPIHRALRKEGYNVMVSHPKKTRLIAGSMMKTDRVDSEALSELARLTLCRCHTSPNQALQSSERRWGGGHSWSG